MHDILLMVWAVVMYEAVGMIVVGNICMEALRESGQHDLVNRVNSIKWSWPYYLFVTWPLRIYRNWGNAQ